MDDNVFKQNKKLAGASVEQNMLNVLFDLYKFSLKINII